MENKANFKGLFNIDAEQIVLGKIISNNDYLIKVNDILNPEYFYELAHQEIYRYIVKTLQKSSIIADSITLKNFFDTNEILASIGGSNYLSILLSLSVGIVDIVDYAKLIQDLAIKRRLIMLGENIVTDTYKQTNILNAKQKIEEIEEKLFDLSNKAEESKNFISMSDSMAQTINNISLARARDGSVSGIPSNLIDLDGLLGGFQNSDLIIIAGRPSMGKSAVAINLAYNASLFFQKEEREGREAKSVGFFSLEMPASQIAMRILSMETGIQSENFRKGQIDDGELNKIIEKADEISKVPLYIDDTAGMTVTSIKTKVRRLIRQHNLGILIVDYLQLIHGVSVIAKQNRVQEISEITQSLKEIAKEFSIPVIALSQLSRTVEQREDRRPQLSDLRESGSIEQDADIVIFIYRESYYEERKKPAMDSPKLSEWMARMDKLRNKSELIIAKHRNGPIGNVELFYNPNTTKFSDLLKNGMR